MDIGLQSIEYNVLFRTYQQRVIHRIEASQCLSVIDDRIIFLLLF